MGTINKVITYYSQRIYAVRNKNGQHFFVFVVNLLYYVIIKGIETKIVTIKKQENEKVIYHNGYLPYGNSI